MRAEILERARRVRLVIFDVDGVLTDGRLFFDHEGREYKGFHARDGHGLKLLRRSGVATAVISGRSSRSVALRCESLGIEHVYQGYEDKRLALQSLQQATGIAPEAMACVGDDVLDLPLLTRVHLAIAVADAHPVVKRHVHWVTALPGGRGAAREVCDLVMAAQQTLDAAIGEYLR
ncbi:3-deoxy-D-manno-octulosonate 8-phosphate phosphatase [Methylomarinovum caldicuralii]|uniref:3-deoxy-D-manno-octulosonate 8-phosphate phosphatase KdsC n=1 Tax=Methylomarinovum caldicuralii TaxID=438856 RepID=A0AAU9C587_9GAMM|nr:HAD hydrolase family protein [Methylomarinovum caldicuralii]BCX81059.1 3-deoxy-D-manno-octulosonate 8-phosphate phosphatase [Methylomarinovum caldicuralii]